MLSNLWLKEKMKTLNNKLKGILLWLCLEDQFSSKIFWWKKMSDVFKLFLIVSIEQSIFRLDLNLSWNILKYANLFK